jgi:hypothetical protein
MNIMELIKRYIIQQHINKNISKKASKNSRIINGSGMGWRWVEFKEIKKASRRFKAGSFF